MTPRQMRRAGYLLCRQADEIAASNKVNGAWPKDDPEAAEAEKECAELRGLSHKLYALANGQKT